MTAQAPDAGVTFINTFTLSAAPEEFEEAFSRTAEFMARQPGFVEHTLMRHTTDGSRYVNIARWDDEQSLRRAVARPEFRSHAEALRALSTSEPHLYLPRTTVRAAG